MLHSVLDSELKLKFNFEVGEESERERGREKRASEGLGSRESRVGTWDSGEKTDHVCRVAVDVLRGVGDGEAASDDGAAGAVVHGKDAGNSGCGHHV